ncbi:MAG TPA: AraC family transcriptional regulator [Anaerolineales bacterium]|nr:AraC family transcriptional regulator [Anaerolineales bacterium]
MVKKEWTNLRHDPQLNVGLLHAYYIEHTYPRHSHDYFVVCLIERGYQSFIHGGLKHVTQPGGIILINPGEVHTGEAADRSGFEMRCFYPTAAHMEMAALELTGHHQPLTFFKQVRIDDLQARRSILSLHRAMSEGASSLECESRFSWTLAQLVKRYGGISTAQQRMGKEKKAVQRARSYIEEHFADGVSLQELARFVDLSPYYFLRVFRAEVGMPPYSYLESVRIIRAQRLIESGSSLAEVAMEAGFSSQSHMTNSFKKIIGATPGQYAQQNRS